MTEKKQLLLLHGALGEEGMFTDLKNKLSDSYEIHTLNFEGHGLRGPSERAFTIQNFSENVSRYMQEHSMDQTDIFGYSMGGYVALYMALVYPEKIRRISTLGTILSWSKEIAEREERLLNPDKIEDKVPRFAEILHKNHPHGWRDVVAKTKDLLTRLGNQPPLNDKNWNTIKHPVRLHIGDRDNTAGLQSTTEVFAQLLQAELCVLPGTPHPFKKVKNTLLENSLREFFS